MPKMNCDNRTMISRLEIGGIDRINACMDTFKFWLRPINRSGRNNLISLIALNIERSSAFGKYVIKLVNTMQKSITCQPDRK